jgi:hypothetical protein
LIIWLQAEIRQVIRTGKASCSGEAAAFGFNAGVPVTPEAAASVWPLMVRPFTAASPAG